MNPQYLSQQPPQYGGSTGPVYGAPQGGYNPSEPSNGSMGSQGFPPSQSRGPPLPPQGGMGPGGMPFPTPNPNQITGHMASMNIGGPPRPSSAGFPGAPMKNALNPSVDGMPDGYSGTINGAPNDANQKMFNANSKQFVNGSMGPFPGGFPPPPSSSPSNPPSHFNAVAPPTNNIPLHPGGPPQQGGLPSQTAKPPMGSNFPPHSRMSSHPAGMPPQPGGMPPQPGGMPPQPGGMPPQPGGMPPQPGGMPPQPGSMPPQPGSIPPHLSGVPSQPLSGGMPPQSGGMPPPPSGVHPQSGNMPPLSSGMPPQPGGMGGQMPNIVPPAGSMMHPPQGSLPPPGGLTSQPGSLLPQSSGMPPPQPGGMPTQANSMSFPPVGMPSQPVRMPPPSGGIASQHGGMPPPPGGIPSQHGGMPPPPGGIPSQASGFPPQQSGMPPPPGGMSQMRGPPQMGGQMPNTVPPAGRMQYNNQPIVAPSPDSYQGNVSGPTGSGYAGSHQPMGSSHMQGHNYSQLPSQPAASHPSLQSQQARRLDPDQMPSPIQVMQDDQRNRSGIFYTNQRGQVPPLVTTDFVTQDQGNAGPRYIRSTMYNIPATIDMMKQTAVPFGIVLSPLAKTEEVEYPPPIVDMGELGPVRCIRCKAYMCPFMQFIDGGRRFHCLFCKATTEVPAEYFQHLDHTGQRVDRFERPELMLGTYEFVATKDYCRNNTYPKPPALIFLIDVSYNNIKSGMVHLLCKEMKEILKLLPKDNGAKTSVMRVGFITYNNTVHFYNIKGCLAQPQMMVVGDVQDMFMPLLDGFLCDPIESEAVIDSLMEQIPVMFADTRETETVLAPAIQAGLEALKASECAGKLLVFHSSLPIAEAPGKLKNRDERKLLGTEKEKTVLAPQVNTYNNLGQDCVSVGCSVDLFVLNNSYIDLATIGQVCRLTGGEIFKYTYFQADLDGDRLISDIKRNVSRPIAFDAIMRVRTSTGVRATDFFGHFFMSNTTDMELASIDCDKAVAVEIKHDDKLTEEDGVYAQVALLYTSCGGQRRLRVLNLAFKTCTQMADLYRSCDLDTIVNFFSKQVVFHLLDSSPKQVKDGLVNRCAQILASYRKNCASPSSAGQLILPECMKLLPLYVNCILKSDAVSGGSDMTIDDRSFVMQAVSIMDLPSSVVYFYPRLIPLHEIDVDSNELPPSVRCTADKIRDDGVYLLENGVHMFLWIGLNVGNDWVLSVFGVHSAAQIDIDRTTLPELDNPLSQRICSLVYNARQQRHRSMRLTLVRQRDKLEMVFKHFLVEDRGFDGSASYVDFLCHMHKEIRNLLS